MWDVSASVICYQAQVNKVIKWVFYWKSPPLSVVHILWPGFYNRVCSNYQHQDFGIKILFLHEFIILIFGIIVVCFSPSWLKYLPQQMWWSSGKRCAKKYLVFQFLPSIAIMFYQSGDISERLSDNHTVSQ